MVSSLIALITLLMIRIRVLICLGLWGVVMIHNQFVFDFCTLLFDSASNLDIEPIEKFFYQKSERLYLYSLD